MVSWLQSLVCSDDDGLDTDDAITHLSQDATRSFDSVVGTQFQKPFTKLCISQRPCEDLETCELAIERLLARMIGRVAFLADGEF